MLDAKQKELLAGTFTPKFMATRDGMGNVNVVMISSIEYYQEMIVFSNLFMWRTARNLEEDPRAFILVMDQNLNFFEIEGHFIGFEETGELVDHLNRSEFTRYNAYTGIRCAGKIEIVRVYPVKKMSLPWFLGKYLASRLLLAHTRPSFPVNVAQKFTTLKSIKVISYLDEDDKPVTRPLPALTSSGDYLITPVKLPHGRRYAACVITPDIVSFQVKGTIERRGLKVEEVYAAGPPVAGKLIYPLAT